MNKTNKVKDVAGGKEVYSSKQKFFRTVISLIMVLYSSLAVVVLLITLLDSFKTKGDLITNFIRLPKELSWVNYIEVLLENDFLLYFKNSLVLTVCGTVGCVLLASMTAYGIARYEFKGRTFLTSYFLFGMMVPVQVSILPLFLILRNIGLLNRLEGLILVYISGISMGCLIFQKFFRTIPKSIEEAARIDGCHDIKIFFEIIFPICKPVIFTVALITAIGQWNDFYMPMVLLGKRDVTTLTQGIYRYIGQFSRYMGESMAAVIVALIPVIIIYFLFSSQIVEGLTGGSVKE